MLTAAFVLLGNGDRAMGTEWGVVFGMHIPDITFSEGCRDAGKRAIMPPCAIGCLLTYIVTCGVASV